MTYTIYVDGEKIGTKKVTVNSNSNTYNEVEEELNSTFDVKSFNHAGKTVSLNHL